MATAGDGGFWTRGTGIARRAGFTALCVLLASGCDGEGTTGSAPEVRPEGELEFVPVRSDAPPLETRDTSFWAFAGEQADLRLRFGGSGGPGTGSRFLEFELDEGSLLSYPDGTPFAPGDSVLISVSVDEGLYRVAFEPSGLAFNPDEPAELELDYDLADEDALEDEGLFEIWRQEQPGEEWVRIESLRSDDLDDIEAELSGFTRFALAVGR